jgi:hypothetical protein
VSARSGWIPTFVDCVYLAHQVERLQSHHTMPLTGRAKMLMGLEATAARREEDGQ